MIRGYSRYSNPNRPDQSISHKVYDYLQILALHVLLAEEDPGTKSASFKCLIDIYGQILCGGETARG